MSKDFPEKDWKKLKSLKTSALEKVCSQCLKKIHSLIEAGQNESHKTYHQLWDILRSDDEKIAQMFDDLKRSSAIFKLIAWKEYGILADNDFKEFSEETQNRINSIIEIKHSE